MAWSTVLAMCAFGRLIAIEQTQQIFHNQPILRVARVLQSQLERTRKASSSTTNAREHVFVQARMYFCGAANS